MNFMYICLYVADFPVILAWRSWRERCFWPCCKGNKSWALCACTVLVPCSERSTGCPEHRTTLIRMPFVHYDQWSKQTRINSLSFLFTSLISAFCPFPSLSHVLVIFNLQIRLRFVMSGGWQHFGGRKPPCFQGTGAELEFQESKWFRYSTKTQLVKF
jgi:hypothetical protein